MDMTEQLAAADLMRAHAATAGLPALAAVAALDLTALWDLSTRHAATALETMRGRLRDVPHG